MQLFGGSNSIAGVDGDDGASPSETSSQPIMLENTGQRVKRCYKYEY